MKDIIFQRSFQPKKQTTRNNMQRDKIQWSMELQNIIQEIIYIIYSQKRLEHNECLNGII